MPLSKETQIYKAFLISMGLAAALCLSAIFLWMSVRTNKLIREQLRERARAQFDVIVLTREWSTRYGGVYVEKKEGVISNPYLADSDITTTDRRVFTKRNPSMMTREISELAYEKGHLHFHMTSLKPLNPYNKPDPFEEKALRLFEAGATEFMETEERGGRPFFRYMAPVYVTSGCLECHASQGYSVNDIRGGISVSYDIDHVNRKLKRNLIMIVVPGMFTIGLFLSLLWYFTARLVRKITHARKIIEKLAMTDGLTKLYNRRYLMERFQEEFERSKRLNRSLGCIMFDLDHFKRVNDRHGHQAGDAVLKKISAAAAGFMRTYDIIGRFGGEEFVIVLPETDLPNSISFAERLRELVKTRTIETASGPVHITASFGVAVLTGEDGTVDDIIRRADEGLYEAKRTGRDRVIAGPKT